MLYLTFLPMILQPCKVQKSQREKNKSLADSLLELTSQKHVNKSGYTGRFPIALQNVENTIRIIFSFYFQIIIISDLD